MKALSIKQILITILIGYLVCAYVQGQFDPFLWSKDVRGTNIVIIGFSLFFQLMIKNFPLP